MPSSLGDFVPTAWVFEPLLSVYHATVPMLLLPLYLYPRLCFPPRAVYFYSASVGRRNFLPVRWFSRCINVWQSSQLTCSTGLLSPLKLEGLLPMTSFHN